MVTSTMTHLEVPPSPDGEMLSPFSGLQEAIIKPSHYLVLLEPTVLQKDDLGGKQAAEAGGTLSGCCEHMQTFGNPVLE